MKYPMWVIVWEGQTVIGPFFSIADAMRYKDSHGFYGPCVGGRETR